MSASDDPIEAVSQRLASFVTDQSATWASEGAEAAGFVRAGADALTGGKRLRARFCLAGWQAVAETRGADDSPAVPGARSRPIKMCSVPMKP